MARILPRKNKEEVGPLAVTCGSRLKGLLFGRYNVNKENIPSRAYIAFRTVENVAAFSQAYDGHIFRDKAGGSLIYFIVIKSA